MTLGRDIHNYDKRYENVKILVEKSDISTRNKNLILKFDNTGILEGLSKPRRIKLMGTLVLLAKRLKEDFDKATERQLKDIIITIDSNDSYSAWTKQSYRSVLKKFYKWLKYGDSYRMKIGYPKIVEWINTNVKRKDQPRVQASDILTEDEIKKLIESAEHPRDKAFISMLYELGARISEIGNLQIKDITRDKYSYIVDLSGKTGHRTPRIVISDPYVTVWLNNHPLRNEPDAPLWVSIVGKDKNRKMQYQALRMLIKRLKEKAGLKKRIHPHLFRHTRVTHLLVNRQINESQAKVYFGWTPSSKMLSEYSHLISADVNDAILKAHGIKTEEEIESKLKPKQCPRCKAINPQDHLFCKNCSSVLDEKTAVALDEQRADFDSLMIQLIEKLDKKDETKEELVRAMLGEVGKNLMQSWHKSKKNKANQ
jgi:site-specific recombinase XerD